jgi:hypothetical protein
MLGRTGGEALRDAAHELVVCRFGGGGQRVALALESFARLYVFQGTEIGMDIEEG